MLLAIEKSVLVVGAFLALVAMSSPIQPDQAEVDPELIRRSIQVHSYDLALQWLSGDGSAEEDFGSRFQRAYCLHQLNRWQEAASLYQDLLSIPSPLSSYVRLFAATCYLGSGRYHEAEDLLISLLEEPDDLLADEGRELLVHVYLKAHRPDQALTVLEVLSESEAREDHLAELFFLMGQAHSLAERPEEAAFRFCHILSQHPSAPIALEALKHLQAIRSLAGEELLDAAQVYFRHRQYRSALAEWSSFAELHPHHLRAPEALHGTARALFHDRRYVQAESICRRLVETYPGSNQVTSARYLMARCAQGDGKTTLAEQRYRQFVRDYPWSQLADDALWQVARIQEQRGDPLAARKAYLSLYRQYASRPRGEEALWRAGLCALWAGDDSDAMALFDRLRARYSNSPWYQGSLYWAARGSMRANRTTLARQLLEQVIALNPESYYSHRAQDLLGDAHPALAAEELQPQDPGRLLTEALGTGIAISEHVVGQFERGSALLRLGLLDRARGELSQVHQVAHQDARLMDDLLQLYETHQLPGETLRLARLVQNHVEQLQGERSLEALLYPRGYLQTVQAEAQKYALEPHFLLAVIWVESQFDLLAVSPAGASGLMQIMPKTGKEIQERLGLPVDSTDNLFRPELNIRLGSYYLWQQLELFERTFEVALAAYNAGPGNVKRWLERFGPVDPELFLELIDFPETRMFVKKVLATEGLYGRIWNVPG